MRMMGYGETMSLPDAAKQNRYKRFSLGRGFNVMGTTEAQLVVVESDDAEDGIIPAYNRTLQSIFRRIEAESFRCGIESTRL